MPAWTNAFAGLAALAAAIGIGRFAFTPILPMMQEDAGLGVAGAAWLASANYLGYLAGALSAIGIRIRPVTAIRAGLLVIGLSTLATGVVQHFALWIVLRLVAGIASAWVLVFVSAWSLERLALLGRADLGGTVYAGVGAGIVVAGAVCLAAMNLHAGSAGTWLSLGVVAMAVAALIWPLLGAAPVSTAAAAVVPANLWSAEDRRLVLCYGVFGFGYIIPATFLPAMAKEIVADPRLFGWAWPVFGAAALVSTVFAAQLKHFLSDREIWIGGHLVMAAGVVVPLVVRGLTGIMAAALLVGGTFMVVTMAAMQEARSVAGPDRPARARALMAAMTSAFAAGQILGPLLVSLLVQSTGSFAPALILAAAVLGLSGFSLRKRKDNP